MVKFGLSLLMVLQFFAFNAHGAGNAPILVELFTSEGCSSCPPAEALLNELSGHKDVVTVAYHVTYWDYLGWKDKYAKKWGTDRQKLYARALRTRTIYTPQMVIDGRHHEVGSKRGQVTELITRRQSDNNRVLISLKRLNREQYQVKVDKTNLKEKPRGKIDIVAVYFIGPQETAVQAGENRGKTLKHKTIAKKIEVIGEWQGKEDIMQYQVTRPADDDITGVAVFAQVKPIGIVLGSNKHIF